MIDDSANKTDFQQSSIGFNIGFSSRCSHSFRRLSLQRFGVKEINYTFISRVLALDSYSLK